jgi:transposase InsO family protein
MVEIILQGLSFSWDITRVPGPYRGVYFYLYAVIDIFNQEVVGWILAKRESGDLERQSVEIACVNRASRGSNRLCIRTEGER